MKRWKSIPIVMLTSVSLIALTGCEEAKVDALVFESLEQCLDDTTMSRGDCEANYKEARDQHAAVAPKYNSEADCLADFGAGQCEKAPYQTQSGGSIFMPLMMGYMMGSMLGGRRSMVSQPLYRTSKNPGVFRTADSRNAGATTGRTQVSKSATSRPSFKSSTVSRGGFGASGRRFGRAAT